MDLGSGSFRLLIRRTVYNQPMERSGEWHAVEALAQFQPAVARWFRQTLGVPTPPQVQAWPVIAEGHSVLLVAPTGSGKTLAAFLVALDRLLHDPQPEQGVRVVYVSPLKALGYDIERNLEMPLAGITRTAAALGGMPEIRVGVRTGDTPPAERRRLLRRPPHILITTPESLHLMLTSSARQTLATTELVIVDEIHALSADKRGTFLAVLLERLQAVTGVLQRVGLSATQRPVREVAHFLGGWCEVGGAMRPRPVRVIDAGMRRALDVQVLSPADDMTALAEGTVWTSICAQLAMLVEQHASTLVFVNSRRVAERVTGEMNELAGYEMARVHHGSVSKERRHELEERLKAGALPCIVATASLELGIDMGAVDLVCQVEAPHGVARAVQRVGRAGHTLRATSRGRLLAKTRADLLELAATAEAMPRAAISPVRIPKGALDLLAQQVVAVVADGPVAVDEVLRLFRRSHPYRDLIPAALERVLEMLSGRLPGPYGTRPRISWDRNRGVLEPLPGTRRAALLGGGAIADRGQYGVFTNDGSRVGELDEEFVFEARVGELVVLGTDRWRIAAMDHDRVIVEPGSGPAKLPFWRGEAPGRDVHLGRKVGALARHIEERIGEPSLEGDLVQRCALTPEAAANLIGFVQAQVERGQVPTDRRTVLEISPDESGGYRMAIMTPFGSRFHLGLKLALSAALRRATGARPECVHGDEGLLFRLTVCSAADVADALAGIQPEQLARLVSEEAGGSPLLGLLFRDAAGRALVFPSRRPGHRTPLWLKRLASRELLESLQGTEGHPVVLEAYRELLEDVLPMGALRSYFRRLSRGTMERVVQHLVAPSPFAASLVFKFEAAFMYEQDTPKGLPTSPPPVEMLAERDLSEFVGEGALAELNRRFTPKGRTGAELVELVRRLGDVGEEELSPLCTSNALHSVAGLLDEGRLRQLRFPTGPELRYVTEEDALLYREALSGERSAQIAVVKRYVGARVLVTEGELAGRYAFSLPDGMLEQAPFLSVRWKGQRAWTRPELLERLRKASRVSDRTRAPRALQRAVLRLQHHGPGHCLAGPDGLAEVLRLLQGVTLPWAAWDGDVLPLRVEGYRAAWMDDLLRSGRFLWMGRPGPRRCLQVVFVERDAYPLFAAAYAPSEDAPQQKASALLEVLSRRGPSFVIELSHSLGVSSERCTHELWALARAGKVTCDGLSPLAAGPPPRGSRSSLWAERSGRWVLLEDPQEAVPGADEALADVLLRRHGVVSREVLRRDGARIPWRTLQGLLERREWRGQVVRGMLVRGLTGVQFALPDTMNMMDGGPSEPYALLSATDPALIWGERIPVPGLTPLETRSVLGPGGYLVLEGGQPVLAVRGHGAHLRALVDDARCLRRALHLIPQLLDRGLERVVVRTFDGRPVRETDAAAALAEVGFVRGPQTMSRYRER